MKGLPLFVLLLLIGWVLLGTWWHHNTCCLSAPLAIVHDTKTIASSDNNLSWSLGTVDLVVPEDTKAALGQLSDYMQKNNHLVLGLTGLMDLDESAGGDLGINRAQTLKDYLVKVGIPAGRIDLLGEKKKDQVDRDETVWGAMDYSFGSMGWFVKDGSGFNASSNDNFVFNGSGYNADPSLSNDFKNSLQDLINYLKSNEDRAFTITGHYTADEPNNSIMPNVGLARANDIKSILVNLGADAGRINLGSQLVDQLRVVGNNVIGAADFSFDEAALPKSDNLDALEKKLRANPFVLYFETNQSSITLSSEERQRFSDLIYYLDRKEGSGIVAVGHTDDVGKRSYNIRLGRKRAEFVKRYLAKNGIRNNRINSESKGPDSPIDTNNNKSGRSKNRRVVVSLK